MFKYINVHNVAARYKRMEAVPICIVAFANTHGVGPAGLHLTIGSIKFKAKVFSVIVSTRWPSDSK